MNVWTETIQNVRLTQSIQFPHLWDLFLSNLFNIFILYQNGVRLGWKAAVTLPRIIQMGWFSTYRVFHKLCYIFKGNKIMHCNVLGEHLISQIEDKRMKFFCNMFYGKMMTSWRPLWRHQIVDVFFKMTSYGEGFRIFLDVFWRQIGKTIAAGQAKSRYCLQKSKSKLQKCIMGCD